MIRGEVTHCLELEDAIGCWGWLRMDPETSISFHIYGEIGLRFLNVIGRQSRRALFGGKLSGKPAMYIVDYWQIL